MSVFYKGDVFSMMKQNIKDKSINLIYIDPPFGTTRNWWDSKLDWSKLFIEFFRVLKDDGMLVIHCSVPFNYELIKSAPKPPSYTWYWDKLSPTNHLGANYQPMRRVEEILVWKNKKTTYYRQQIGDETHEYSRRKVSKYYGDVKPPGEIIRVVGLTRSNIITMKRVNREFSTRPDELVKLMIDSYSKDGDTILDCFSYKGLSYSQSKGRRWIGIDLNFIPNFIVDGNSK